MTFDAIFAFAALRFAKVPMLRQFGLLLAVGVATICINSIMGPLAILGIREYKSPTKSKDFRAGPLGRLVVWLGSISAKAAVWLAIASLIIFTGGILVEGKLMLQTDPIQWVNQKSQVIKDLHVLDKQIRLLQRARRVRAVQRGLQRRERRLPRPVHARARSKKYPTTLLTAASLVEVVSDLSDVPGAQHVAPTGAQVKAAYDVAPKDIQLSTVVPSGKALNLVYRTGPSGLDARAEVVRHIRKTANPPAGVSATPSGLAVVGVGLLDNLEANRVELTYLAIALRVPVPLRPAPERRARTAVARPRAHRGRCRVAVRVRVQPQAQPDDRGRRTARGRRVHRVHVTDPAALRRGAAARLLAACRDRSHRVAHRPRRSSSPRSPRSPASRSSRTSSLPLLRDFGIVVGLNVTVALLSALVVLPPMLVWADSGGRNWVSKRLVPKEILETANAPAEPVLVG